jgi:SAM-dependent methyltransferase
MEARKQREQQFHDTSYAEAVRAPLEKFYHTITEKSWREYRRLIGLDSADLEVLEYGCGTGSFAFELARMGARVTAIDLSPVALAQANHQARELGLNSHITCRTMDAEHLDFGDCSFDRIIGSGILHHLDLRRAYAEVARVLRPHGQAIFAEPLGHNPLINLYRKRTPQYRTVDEHPLRHRDLELAERFFGHVETRYYHLATLAAIPFRGRSFFRPLVGTLDALDTGLFRLPKVRYLAWYTILIMSEPKAR